MNLPNQFRNAKVISVGTDPRTYHKSNGEVQRGKPEFIMSRGELVKFFSCPRKWMAGIPETSSKSTEFGSLMDCIVTSPQRFDETYALEPTHCIATKTMKAVKEGKVAEGERTPWNPLCTEAKEWKAEQEKRGLIPIGLDELADTERAVERLHADQNIAELLNCSAKQVFCMAEYHDRATGLSVPIKILIDLMPDKANELFGKSLADFKTTRDASPRKYQRQIFENGLHVQAALYLDVYCAATGEDRTEFLHVVQENTAPFECCGVSLWEENEAGYLHLGRMTYLSMLEFYCQCLARDLWPGYSDLYALYELHPAHSFRTLSPEAWMIGAGGVTTQFPDDEPTRESQPSEMPS